MTPPTEGISLVMQGTLLLLVVAVGGALVRLIRGPSAPDRIVALDLIGGLTVGIIATYCALTGETGLLRVAMGVALVSFIGTVAISRYLEKSVR